jgi:nucleoside-diphosphate-sugar epimerase
LKILVTGGSGFTGQNFIKQASLLGHIVISIDADLLDKVALRQSINALEFDAVIHLAALSFVGHEDKSDFYSVNVLGTMNLLEAIESVDNSQLKSIVLASSAHVYGNKSSLPIAEGHDVSPNSHYATSKLAMEIMSKTYLDRLPILFVRPFNYTGPGQNLNFVIPKIVDHFSRQEKTINLGNLDVEREYNDIRFVCDAYLALIEYGRIGDTYNLCTGSTFTLRHILDSLTEITKHHLDVRVCDKLVRTNDIKRLCGDPDKLLAVFLKAGLSLQKYPLEDTLKSMLREYPL